MPWGLGWANKVTSLVLDKETGRKRVREMLELFEDADVICLQEVWDTVLHRWSDVVREEAEAFGFQVSAAPIPCGYPVNSGLAILSKYAVSDASSHVFGASSGLQWFVPKGFQHVMLLTEAYEVFHVLNTHIHATAVDTALCNSPHKSIRIQQRQIMQISKYMRENILPPHLTPSPVKGSIDDHVPLVILSGDFNVDAINAVPDTSTVTFAWLESHFRLRFKMRHMSEEAEEHLVTYPFFSLPVSQLVDRSVYEKQFALDHIFSTYPFHDTPTTLRLYDTTADCNFSDHAAVQVDIYKTRDVHTTTTTALATHTIQHVIESLNEPTFLKRTIGRM